MKFNAWVNIPTNLESLPNDDPEKTPRILSHCNKALRLLRLRGNVKPLSEEEYLLLAKFEPRLRHPARKGLDLVHFDTDAVRAIYKRFGFL